MKSSLQIELERQLCEFDKRFRTERKVWHPNYREINSFLKECQQFTVKKIIEIIEKQKSHVKQPIMTKKGGISICKNCKEAWEECGCFREEVGYRCAIFNILSELTK